MTATTAMGRTLAVGALCGLCGLYACSRDRRPEAPEHATSVGGEAALDAYPEHDEQRADDYDPPTETDAYMHQESNDDQMLQEDCMSGDCP